MDTRVETMDSKETSATPKRCPLFSKEATFCHAAKAARNDRESGFFKQDSRSCGGAVDFHRVQRILGFCDDFVRREKKHKGVTSSGNDRRAFLTLAQKRAKQAQRSFFRKAESTSETKTESTKGVL